MLGQRSKREPIVAFYRTIGLNSKNPPKLRFKKFVKLTGYLCLQQFDKFWKWSAYNDLKRKSSKFAETCLEKNTEITSSELIYGEFYLFGTTVCRSRFKSLQWQDLTYLPIYSKLLPKISNCTCLICPSFRSAFRNALFQCHMCHWLIAKLDHAIFYRDVWFAGLGCCWIQTRIAISYCKVHISWEGH